MKEYLTKLDNDYYKLHCDCYDDSCIADIFIEEIEDTHLYSMIFCVSLKPSKIYSFDTWYKRLWYRFKYAIQVLFDLDCELSHELILNEKSIESLKYVIEQFEKKNSDDSSGNFTLADDERKQVLSSEEINKLVDGA